MDEDFDIIVRVRAGDYDAFESLVEKYQGRIYRHIRKMVKDTSHVEDLLQETFLNAYKGLKGFEGSSTFSTWLFRIATNTSLMFLRKNRGDTIEYDDEVRDTSELPFRAMSPEFISTPLDILLSLEGREAVEKAIDELPILYRTVLVLRDVEGFSLGEVSKIVDSSVAAVKSRLHRARNSVREALHTYYAEKKFSPQRSAYK
jgi:RNA polymerase sigma-70 factor, ECF subfamily